MIGTNVGVSRRRILGSGAALVAGTVAAACGTSQTGTAPAKSAAPVSLRITSWLVEQPSVDTYNKELFAPFKDVAPNTTLTQEATAFAAYPDKVQAYAASGDMPDILEVSYAWFPEWIKVGLLEN